MKKLWKKIKHWFCKVGLCNLNKCKSDYHKKTAANLEGELFGATGKQKENLKKVIEVRQPTSIKRVSRRSLPREERRRLKRGRLNG